MPVISSCSRPNRLNGPVAYRSRLSWRGVPEKRTGNCDRPLPSGFSSPMAKLNSSSNLFSAWVSSILPLQPLPSCCSIEVKKLVCSWSL
ncbi:hypothetical protein D3C79_865770 [compost metagenome]